MNLVYLQYTTSASYDPVVHMNILSDFISWNEWKWEDISICEDAWQCCASCCVLCRLAQDYWRIKAYKAERWLGCWGERIIVWYLRIIASSSSPFIFLLPTSRDIRFHVLPGHPKEASAAAPEEFRSENAWGAEGESKEWGECGSAFMINLNLCCGFHVFLVFLVRGVNGTHYCELACIQKAARYHCNNRGRFHDHIKALHKVEIGSDLDTSPQIMSGVVAVLCIPRPACLFCHAKHTEVHHILLLKWERQEQRKLLIED